jgi:nucleoside-diphosphate-sugar epimerase
MPVTEDAPLRPTSLFAASKVAAETYGRAFHACHHLDTVILRYFSVYGPRQKPGSGGPLVGNVIEAIRQRRGLVNRPELGTNDFINVDDAVAATVAAGRAPRAAGHAINVGSGQAASVEELVQVVGNALGTAFVPSAGSGRGVGSTQVTAGIARAAELLDFAPRVSLVEGVGRLVRVMAEAEQPRPDTLASVGLD